VNELDDYAFRVDWSDEDDCFVATVGEFPSLSYVDEVRERALAGLQRLVDGVLQDLDQEAQAGYDPDTLRPYRP
jgi:predicted RNase H-like HicB family nuclease